MSGQDNRATDQCVCGRPRSLHYPYTPTNCRGFQSAPQPNRPPPVPDSFHRIVAVRIGGKWSAEVFGEGKVGQGFAKSWLDAVNAAIEDLKEKVA